jgi:ATP-dependent RNA helicase DDX24/MAK5
MLMWNRARNAPQIDLVPPAQVADLTSKRKIADKVAEAYISCNEKERDALLFYILATHPGRTLIFLNAISGIRRVAAVLKLLGIPVQVR